MVKEIVTVLCILMVSSCARMTVQVDVLDHSYLDRKISDEQVDRENQELRRLYYSTTSDDNNAMLAALDAIKTAHAEAIRALAKAYQKVAATPGVKADQASLFAFASKNLTDILLPGADLDKFYYEKRVELQSLDQAIRQEAARAPVDRERPIPLALVAVLQKRRIAAQAITTSVQLEIQRLTAEVAQRIANFAASQPSLPATLAVTAAKPDITVAQGRERAIESIGRSITGGRTLTESPYAHIVVGAPDQEWKKRINKVYGDALFGNADIAIKLEHHADFTLKGMSFDPSKVAEVARKVLTQSLVVAAQIAGVPVALRSGQGQGDGVGAVGSSSRISDAQQQIARRESAYADVDRALRLIAAAILDQAKALDDGQTTQARVDEIRQLVRARYDANKSRLSLGALQSGG